MKYLTRKQRRQQRMNMKRQPVSSLGMYIADLKDYGDRIDTRDNKLINLLIEMEKIINTL